jgi:hypothetical protein
LPDRRDFRTHLFWDAVISKPSAREFGVKSGDFSGCALWFLPPSRSSVSLNAKNSELKIRGRLLGLRVVLSACCFQRVFFA